LSQGYGIGSGWLVRFQLAFASGYVRTSMFVTSFLQNFVKLRQTLIESHWTARKWGFPLESAHFSTKEDIGCTTKLQIITEKLLNITSTRRPTTCGIRSM
jgi:hypothetical protein